MVSWVTNDRLPHLPVNTAQDAVKEEGMSFTEIKKSSYAEPASALSLSLKCTWSPEFIFSKKKKKKRLTVLWSSADNIMKA